MISTVKALCVIAALLANLGGSAAMASPLLTAEEMGTVRGGCTQQKYCKSYDCGTSQACKQGSEGDCTPGSSEEGCDNTYVLDETVQNCGSLVPNQKPCTQGPQTACGTMADCDCYDPPLQPCCHCRTINTTHPWTYHPCVE